MAKSSPLTPLLLLFSGIAAIVILRIAAPPRWFELYGVAAGALIGLPGLHMLLWRSLRARGRWRWWSMLISAPLMLAAAIQILFWTVYFSDTKLAVALGTARGLIQGMAGPYLIWIVAAFALLAGLVVIKAVVPKRV